MLVGVRSTVLGLQGDLLELVPFYQISSDGRFTGACAYENISYSSQGSMG
jgi:hypothetical protein